ncbi:MAG: lysylphosphatidylglycerol synthase transmembrane domain-containing protein [Parcubacteria group bacterium]|jgi:hypothetical protein
MSKKAIKIILKITVSLFFVILVVYKTNWPEVLFYLKKIQLWQIFLYILVYVISIAISSYKWKILSEFKNIRHSFNTYFKLYLTGTFINNFMPSFVAGDAYKAYEIAKPHNRYMEASSTVIMDRITGLIGAMVLALVFSAINYKTLLANDLLMFIDALIVLSLCTDVIIAKLKTIPAMRNFVMRILPEKAVDFLQQIYNYSNNTAIIKKAVLWGMAFSIIGVAFLNYILFWGLGIDVNFFDYMSVIFIISIVSALPITVNNIGLKEWAYITFFGIFGISSGAVVAISVISRFLQMAISFTALPAYLRSRK